MVVADQTAGDGGKPPRQATDDQLNVAHPRHNQMRNRWERLAIPGVPATFTAGATRIGT